MTGVFLNLLRILQRKKYKRICKRKFCKGVKSTHEAKISTGFKTTVKIREGFMMNFYCTIKFEELSLPTFFQGKKKRFETIFFGALSWSKNGKWSRWVGLHPTMIVPYMQNLVLIIHSHDNAKTLQKATKVKIKAHGGTYEDNWSF